MREAIYIIIALCIVLGIMFIVVVIKNKNSKLTDDQYIYIKKQINDIINDTAEEEAPKEKKPIMEPIKHDIAGLLLVKGYSRNYSLMTEEQKNQVMVYLMALRDQNKITIDEYKKETIKLWRR
ncbi:MAG: hypothetical protein WCR33_01530 [Bacilli bacterium]